MAEKTIRKNNWEQETLQTGRVSDKDVEGETAGHGGCGYNSDFIIVAIFAPLIAPYGMNDVHSLICSARPIRQVFIRHR